jgi:hypothetical protein
MFVQYQSKPGPGWRNPTCEMLSHKLVLVYAGTAWRIGETCAPCEAYQCMWRRGERQQASTSTHVRVHGRSGHDSDRPEISSSSCSLGSLNCFPKVHISNRVVNYRPLLVYSTVYHENRLACWIGLGFGGHRLTVNYGHDDAKTGVSKPTKRCSKRIYAATPTGAAVCINSWSHEPCCESTAYICEINT